GAGAARAPIRLREWRIARLRNCRPSGPVRREGGIHDMALTIPHRHLSDSSPSSLGRGEVRLLSVQRVVCVLSSSPDFGRRRFGAATPQGGSPSPCGLRFRAAVVGRIGTRQSHTTAKGENEMPYPSPS